MKRLLTPLFTLMALVASAQSSNISTLFTGNFKKAETLYNQFAYRNALPLYLHTVEKDPSNHTARERVADCYFRLGNILEAEKWYAALAKEVDGNPRYKYRYAQILSILGRYEHSKTWYTIYLQAVDDRRAKSKLDFIDHLPYYMRDSSLYEISHEAHNSDQSDFSPRYYKDGIVFVSARDRDLFIKKKSLAALNDDEAMLNVFFAAKSAQAETDATLFYQHELNSPYHDGPVSFYKGGQKMAFSRSNLRAGKPVSQAGRVNLELYFADIDDQKKLSRLEVFPFNSSAHSIGHPWVSEDGNTLYFSSDMPGGEGGTDIYTSQRLDGKWQPPLNLGPSINTLGNEFYPFLASDSVMYFSSDGHGGLGGLDIYSSLNYKGDFQTPRNLGFPLNTSSDDFSFILDATGKNGLFASNRPGGVGYDDIYRFKVKSYFIEGKVINRSDSTQTLSNAMVYLTGNDRLRLDSIASDEQGRFHFDLDFDKDYSLSAYKKGFSWIDKLTYSTRSKVLGHDSLLLALWEHSLFAKGIVYSNESQSKLSGATVILKNLTDGVADSIVTDHTGAYSFLVKPGNKYTISAHEKKFLPQEFHLNTKGLFRGNLLNDIVLEEVFLDMVVVQFDFDKHHIKDSEIPKLDKLLRDLKRKRVATIKISAFADSQGTDEYNQDLSDRRAASVKNYFQSAGVNLKRIEAIGFGETLLLNRCSDGVVCDDHEHSKNRRAELKVQIAK